MFCGNCGNKLADDATFCSRCGSRVRGKEKNMYIALALTFVLTGLGSIYAGNTKKGLILLIARVLLAVITMFITEFGIVSVLIWAYGFYEAYRDIQVANGHHNPKLINDFRGWDQNRRTIAIVIIAIILIITLAGISGFLVMNKYSSVDSNTHYYTSGSGSGGSSHSSHSSHYGGVDTSPSTIAKNDPDWYYDHYEYGDNPDIDDYLESQGYD